MTYHAHTVNVKLLAQPNKNKRPLGLIYAINGLISNSSLFSAHK